MPDSVSQPGFRTAPTLRETQATYDADRCRRRGNMRLMRSVVFPYAARILGYLGIVLEVAAVVTLAVEVQIQGSSWLWLQLSLYGGFAAVLGALVAEFSEPPGAGKRPAAVALFLMGGFIGLVVLLLAALYVLLSFGNGD